MLFFTFAFFASFAWFYFLRVLTHKVMDKLSDTLKVSDSDFLTITFCVITPTS